MKLAANPLTWKQGVVLDDVLLKGSEVRWVTGSDGGDRSERRPEEPSITGAGHCRVLAGVTILGRFGEIPEGCAESLQGG
ncbi:hypothetical protein G3T14_10805 [Methylobacterium sp. BTF04]|uniref:hypothetical protein n=1 Tax=Methylobacterium sp. BTF04 TaxID=2708300 RepID=UPI0013D346AA|nr:hypothetical protein [Methylobacterium sp. BTF04]NEU12627.1 hypothetical protein [Methylobacterium sp. BTF04]